MATEQQTAVRLEIGHVLFIDVVSYSKLSINEQRAAVDELNEVVRTSEQFQNAEADNRLLKIATGDGMALVFYTSPEAPVQCALEISRAMKEHPRLQMRMGIHSGPVSGVVDVNGRANLAGAGLNIAQRVMDCGDAGHILLSKHVAEDLEEYEQWRPLLHNLGTCEVKHGVRLGIANLYAEGVGNPQLPEKLKQQLRKRVVARRRQRALVAGSLVVLVALLVGSLMFFRRSPPKSQTTAVELIPEKSIAVLPFENRSEGKTSAYFADGIQDEILTHLSKIADLKVISRTSTQQYPTKPGNLSEIARQLGVATILEGSVQKIDDTVRVNVQLIKAANDSHLWAETFDRKLTDIFAVETEIAKGIAESLQLKLSGREQQLLAIKPTDIPEAYDAYLRGLAFEAHPDYYANDALEKAIGAFEKAVRLDPTFALAWARLSQANAALYFTNGYTPATARDAAKRALDNAQKLQPNSPDTLLALGYYQYWLLRDYELSKTSFKLVSKILPGRSDVPAALAKVARRAGDWDESIAYAEQALILDPRNIETLLLAAANYTMVRQFSAALKLIDRALEIASNDAALLKAPIYQAEGKLEESARLLAKVDAESPSESFALKIKQLWLERNPGEAVRLMQARLAQSRFGSDAEKGMLEVMLAFGQRFAGDVAGAKATAEQLCKSEPDSYEFAADLSGAYALAGDKGLALKEAERATMLVPSAKDAVSGPGLEENLAAVEMIFDNKSRAISILARLVKIPYGNGLHPTPVTKALLRLDPTWDPLRADPAFQKLCEEKPR